MMTTMYSHQWKKWGYIISAIGLILMIAERLSNFIIIKKLNAEQHYALFVWIMLVGLTTIIYSKEKYDDDRVKLIRLKSFQTVFILMLAALLGVGLSTTIATKSNIEPTIEAGTLFFIAAFGIIFYLLIFHFGLYFDFFVEYDDATVGENIRDMKKNRWGVLAYLICAAVTLILLYLITP